MKTANLKKKGFTLVEILIVIAIISLVVLLGFSSYGIAQKKARLDMAASSVQSMIAEARDKSKSGHFEAGGDILAAKSLCYGFRAYPGGSFELLSTTFNRLAINDKCSRLSNDIKVVKQLETLQDIIIKKIESFGKEQIDPVVVFFMPPKGEAEITVYTAYTDEPFIKFNVGYANSDSLLDQRQVVFNILSGTVKLQLLRE